MDQPFSAAMAIPRTNSFSDQNRAPSIRAALNNPSGIELKLLRKRWVRIGIPKIAWKKMSDPLNFRLISP